MAVGALAILWIIYAQFFSQRRQAHIDPEVSADEWDATMNRLGIAPVFPPEEDLRVGDLYALLGDDIQATAPPKSRVEIRFGQAVKLDHLRVVDERLVDVYKSVVVFPPTAPRPADHTASWVQPDCSGPCFEGLKPRQQLPLVLFPGFTLAQARQASTGLSWAGATLRSVLGVTGETSQSVDISVPYAESYGIPSLMATGLLREYCDAATRRDVCTDETIRNQLSMVRGDSVYESVPGSNGQQYRYPVRLILISRVYLTRSIQYGFAADSAIGAQARMVSQIQQRLSNEQEQARQGPVPSGQSDDPAKAQTTTTATQIALEEQRQRLEKVVQEASLATANGNLRVQIGDSDHVYVDQTLPRPVTIGFNAVLRLVTKQGDQNHVNEPE
jgi:hypothetical protein